MLKLRNPKPREFTNCDGFAGIFSQVILVDPRTIARDNAESILEIIRG